MLNLLIAITIALVCAVLSGFVLTELGVAPTVAQTVATGMLALVPSLREACDRWRLRARPASERIMPLAGFQLAWGWQLLYGLLLMFAGLQLASGIGGLAAAVSGADEAGAGVIIMVVSAFVGIPVMFLGGRWIGRRSPSGRWWLPIVAVVLTRSAATAIDFAFVRPDAFENMFGQTPSMTFAATQIGGGSLLFGVPALIGYWRGRRQHLATYLGYLLKRIDRETRTAIIALAYEEAARERVPQNAPVSPTVPQFGST